MRKQIIKNNKKPSQKRVLWFVLKDGRSSNERGWGGWEETAHFQRHPQFNFEFNQREENQSEKEIKITERGGIGKVSRVKLKLRGRIDSVLRRLPFLGFLFRLLTCLKPEPRQTKKRKKL